MALNILVVDDSCLVRKAIKRIIEMIELEVDTIHEAANGQEALDVLSKGHIDLVLSDLNMPQMGGIEMFHRMRTEETTKSIPVVIVTTESSIARVKELLEEGIKDYLHKPFTPEEFREIIFQTLEKG